MASYHSTREGFLKMLSAQIAHKAGVELSPEQIVEMLCAEAQFKHHVEPPTANVGMEYGELESVVEYLLYRLGRFEERNSPSIIEGLAERLVNDPMLNEMWLPVRGKFAEVMTRQVNDPATKSLDFSELFQFACDQYGIDGLSLAWEMVEDQQRQAVKNAISACREIEWKDTVELEMLFKSERLETQYGTFFDQRFIDYLHRNYGDIGEIHWRQFEALTAEFFKREGLEVELGPGRNDENIDVRVWPKDGNMAEPPLIIIQCKRQKEKVGKVVLKALYADLLDQKAKTGLIVTTSELSPGAWNVRKARSYPIGTAERKSIKKWIDKMRKPGL